MGDRLPKGPTRGWRPLYGSRHQEHEKAAPVTFAERAALLRNPKPAEEAFARIAGSFIAERVFVGQATAVLDYSTGDGTVTVATAKAVDLNLAEKYKAETRVQIYASDNRYKMEAPQGGATDQSRAVVAVQRFSGESHSHVSLEIVVPTGPDRQVMTEDVGSPVDMMVDRFGALYANAREGVDALNSTFRNMRALLANHGCIVVDGSSPSVVNADNTLHCISVALQRAGRGNDVGKYAKGLGFNYSVRSGQEGALGVFTKVD